MSIWMTRFVLQFFFLFWTVFHLTWQYILQYDTNIAIHISFLSLWKLTSRWHEHHGVSNHRQPDICFTFCSFYEQRNINAPPYAVTICQGNPSVLGGGFPSQCASNVESVPMWWRLRDKGTVVNSTNWLSLWSLKADASTQRHPVHSGLSISVEWVWFRIDTEPKTPYFIVNILMSRNYGVVNAIM